MPDVGQIQANGHIFIICESLLIVYIIQVRICVEVANTFAAFFLPLLLLLLPSNCKLQFVCVVNIFHFLRYFVERFFVDCVFFAFHFIAAPSCQKRSTTFDDCNDQRRRRRRRAEGQRKCCKIYKSCGKYLYEFCFSKSAQMLL